MPPQNTIHLQTHVPAAFSVFQNASFQFSFKTIPAGTPGNFSAAARRKTRRRDSRRNSPAAFSKTSPPPPFPRFQFPPPQANFFPKALRHTFFGGTAVYHRQRTVFSQHRAKRRFLMCRVHQNKKRSPTTRGGLTFSPPRRVGSFTGQLTRSLLNFCKVQSLKRSLGKARKIKQKEVEQWQKIKCS